MRSVTTPPSVIPASPPGLPDRSIPSLDELRAWTSEPDHRVVIKGVAWAFYEQLVNSIPEGANIHVDYDGKDLEIEVDLSPPKIDRPAIYAALRVAEVWRFDGEAKRIVIERLREDGTNQPVDMSEFLPVRSDEVGRWVLEEDRRAGSRSAQRLRAWVRAELAPRLRADLGWRARPTHSRGQHGVDDLSRTRRHWRSQCHPAQTCNGAMRKTPDLGVLSNIDRQRALKRRLLTLKPRPISSSFASSALILGFSRAICHDPTGLPAQRRFRHRSGDLFLVARAREGSRAELSAGFPDIGRQRWPLCTLFSETANGVMLTIVATLSSSRNLTGRWIFSRIEPRSRSGAGGKKPGSFVRMVPGRNCCRRKLTLRDTSAQGALGSLRRGYAAASMRTATC